MMSYLTGGYDSVGPYDTVLQQLLLLPSHPLRVIYWMQEKGELELHGTELWLVTWTVSGRQYVGTSRGLEGAIAQTIYQYRDGLLVTQDVRDGSRRKPA